MNVIRFLSIIILLVLVACSPNTGNKRDVIVQATLVSIDKKLPPMHKMTQIYALDDLLIFYDFMSVDRHFFAYDVINDSSMSWFGKHGNGPGEISNFANICFDRKNGILYGLDGNRWQFLGFNVKEAIHNQDYNPFLKTSLDTTNGRTIVNMAQYINDSTVICTIYYDLQKGSNRKNLLGRINLLTGETTAIEKEDPDGELFSIAVMPESNRVFMAGKTRDILKITDFQGNIINTIKGADFRKTRDKQLSYFSNAISGGGYFFAVFNGKYDSEHSAGKDILVFDKDGNYLKTLCIDVPIVGICYNYMNNRLYVSTDDTPQFGYIQL